MSLFNRKAPEQEPQNGWICPKCSTFNSLNTNECITCHSKNHSVAVSRKDNDSDSFLFRKSSEPPVNNCPPPSKKPKTAGKGDRRKQTENDKEKSPYYKCSECGMIYQFDSFCSSCGSRARSVADKNEYMDSLSGRELEQFKKADFRELQCEQKHRRTWSGFVHLSGLPFAERAKCDIWECDDKLVFYRDTIIALPYSQIISIECISSTEVRTHFVDNTSGAIAGGLLFGVLGAIAFGGTKTIVEKETTYFLTITYQSKGDTKYIIFDAAKNYSTAQALADRIKSYLLSDGKGAIKL